MESAIKNWLSKKRNFEVPGCLLGSVGLLAAGLVVLALTAYFCFFLFLFAWLHILAGWELVSGHHVTERSLRGVAIFTGVFMALLFIGNARSTWWERGDIPKGVWPARRRGDAASPVASLVAMTKFITDLFYSGPRLLTASWRTFRKALRLRQLDLDNCSRVLWVLLTAGRAVSREELMAQLADGDWGALEGQLKNIDGVLFLEHGLSLEADLRSELVEKLHAPA